MKIILEAGTQLSLIGPGGFVDIGPAGITIQGTLVRINSGGAAGSGSGSSPVAPQDPDVADDGSSTGKLN
jgi:type VI secretion system secreted protein VgrG